MVGRMADRLGGSAETTGLGRGRIGATFDTNRVTLLDTARRDAE
jgi:hypothetical protein